MRTGLDFYLAGLVKNLKIEDHETDIDYCIGGLGLPGQGRGKFKFQPDIPLKCYSIEMEVVEVATYSGRNLFLSLYLYYSGWLTLTIL